MSKEKESQSSDDKSVIDGDFYVGAYGPTLLLVLDSTSSAERLRRLFLDQVDRMGRYELVDQLTTVNHLTSIGLVTNEEGRDLESKRVSNGSDDLLTLSGTKQGWRRAADLLEPFCLGQTGHQYLCEEDDDDALIEISYGEGLSLR